MKISKLLLLFLISGFITRQSHGQANASLNILTQNVGVVSLDGTVYVEVSVGNTGPISSINGYKIKTQISVPSNIASIPTTGHQLPAGWTVTSNNGATINLSNGTDVIPVNEVRTILIAVQGTAIGGPLTIAGGISFSNGNPPGTAPGTLNGDNTADNISTSTIQVTNTTPITLVSFNAAVVDCHPVLKWTTEAEINSDRFEIQKTNTGTTNWTTVGTVTAKGHTSGKSSYTFTDNENSTSSGISYRLKMIDRNEKARYSLIVAVSINCKTTQISIYPNPIKNNKIHLFVTGLLQTAKATVLSAEGQLVANKTITDGDNVIDVSALASGTYYISVDAENKNIKKLKIVVQH